MEDLLERVEQAERQIAAVRNKTARRDLIKMLKPIDSALNRMSKESVECRRLHRPTARYQQLEQEAQDLMSHLEKYLVFACLLGG
jgi:hypothetical protein